MKYWLLVLLVLVAAVCMAQETSKARGDRFYVTGAVNQPGAFPIPTGSNSITVAEALKMAGGINRVANRTAVLIIHCEPDGARTERKVNLKLKQDLDVTLGPNDVLFIPSSVSKKKVLRPPERVLIAVGAQD